jgi:hypothetical protein
VIRYLDHAATSLHEPQEYIRTVLTGADGGVP